MAKSWCFFLLIGLYSFGLMSCKEPRRRVLVIAAEQDELNCAQRAYEDLNARQKAQLRVDFLLSGIGTNHSSYALTKHLLSSPKKHYDLLLDIGIAGSYDTLKYPLGAVAFVSREYFADLGFQLQDKFRDLFESRLLNPEAHPFSSGGIQRQSSNLSALETWVKQHPIAHGATVQTVTGITARGETIRQHYPVEIESMEGASIYYVARMEQLACLEIRSISNVVGETQQSRWNIPLALEKLKLALDTALTKIAPS